MDCTNCELSNELEKLKAEVDHLKEEIGPEKPPCGSDCTCDDCDILKKCPKYKEFAKRYHTLLIENSNLKMAEHETNRLNSIHRDRANDLLDDLATEKRVNKVYRNTCIISFIAWIVLLVFVVLGGLCYA